MVLQQPPPHAESCPSEFVVGPSKRTYKRKNSSDLFEVSIDINGEIRVMTPPKKRKSEDEPTLLTTPKKIDFNITHCADQPKRKTYDELLQIIQRQRISINRYRVKLSRMGKKTKVNAGKTKTPSALFIDILQRKKRKCPWTKPEKKLIMGLYFKSPATYKYMRDSLQFSLPSVSTIRRSTNIRNMQPGIVAKVFDKLKQKLTTVTEKWRQFLLMTDETTIKRAVDYNSVCDSIEGFMDTGKLGRSPKYARHL